MAFCLLEDNRWGGSISYLGDSEEPLLVHPNVRRCAVFLGRREQGQSRITATGFFLWFKDAPYNFIYLVTARHVICNAKKYSDDRKVDIYLNSVVGTRFKPIRISTKDWFYHPSDPAIDVAAIPFKLSPDVDHSALEPEVYEMALEQKQWHIDVGTDVFITGLFQRREGNRRNIPIVRTGTIAAMPDEPIFLKLSKKGKEHSIRAYLIETHSIGGLSGSPVFANPMDVAIKQGRIALRTIHPWIGLVSGHWQFDEDSDERDKLNSGIAIVSPRESVLEVLETNPALIEMRAKEKERKRKNEAPQLDEAYQPRKTRDIPIPPISREKFFEDLTKATNRKETK
jgi:hypothetical protein